ncbi:hypothetical protein [Fibrobacter sp.]|uniref:hypothetical protein n=1 Tax=Fibrobacter sp. TaxID=35828 RepID=UPI00388D8989
MKKISTITWILLLLCASAFAEIADIEKNGDWYYLYNEKGCRYKTMSVKEIGTIKSVTSKGFTSKNNGFIYTWDKKGKRTGTRPAN